MPCMQLTDEQLASLIAEGWTKAAGPYTLEADCQAVCGVTETPIAGCPGGRCITMPSCIRGVFADLLGSNCAVGTGLNLYHGAALSPAPPSYADTGWASSPPGWYGTATACSGKTVQIWMWCPVGSGLISGLYDMYIQFACNGVNGPLAYIIISSCEPFSAVSTYLGSGPDTACDPAGTGLLYMTLSECLGGGVGTGTGTGSHGAGGGGGISSLGVWSNSSETLSGASLVSPTLTLAPGEDIVVNVATRWTGTPLPVYSAHFAGAAMLGTLGTNGAVNGDLALQIFYLRNFGSSPIAGKITLDAADGTYLCYSMAANAVIVDGLPGGAATSVYAVGTGTAPDSGMHALTFSPAYLQGAVGTAGPSTDADGTWQDSFVDGAQDIGTTGAVTGAPVRLCEGRRIVSPLASYRAAKASITSRNWIAAWLGLG